MALFSWKEMVQPDGDEDVEPVEQTFRPVGWEHPPKHVTADTQKPIADFTDLLAKFTPSHVAGKCESISLSNADWITEIT